MLFRSSSLRRTNLTLEDIYMNRLDEVMKDLESRGYGEHTERIGNGVF